MKQYLFNPENKFYKANMHSHSKDSDGVFTPAELKEHYMAEGYQIIAYSDHRTMIPHTELSDDNFLAITASEFNCGNPAYSWPSNPTYHLNFYAKNENATEFIPFVREYTVENINKVIREAKEAGFLCQYNHPRWSMQTPEDYLDLENLWGFEIFNSGSEELNMNGNADYEYGLYCRYGKSKNVAVTAGDDNHGTVGRFMGFTMINAPSLKYADVLDALEKGDCYASTGPIIEELYIEDGYLNIKCSPVTRIAVMTDTRASNRAYSEDGKDSLTSARIPLNIKTKYIRVILVDSYNRRAWTRAYDM
ncbi:MAG: PHP domain-containing protein [Ruminococcaceae bacterium]|nr:PHP domain-containing protein [Oscillospiraceae bacterium]